jgi:nitronate monooxygenase
MIRLVVLRTAFTEVFSIRHPIALAPMGAASGGALAAAVSNAGGLGLIGGGRQDAAWLDRELSIVADHTDRPWGVGFQTWAASRASIERALLHEPNAVMLSFGDPRPFAGLIRASGAVLIIQVTDLAEARQAIEAGPDIIVAQGTEAGGHGGRRSTLPFVPTVADLAAPTPVLAAGGIADGRGLAAALTLGAAGALIGTRFLVALEALVPAWASKAILASSGEDTERGRLSDIAREAPWPATWTARTLRNSFLDEWRDREAEFERDVAARQAYQAAVARGDVTPEPVWASEAIDLISEMSPAADIVALLAAQAEEALARAGRR